MTKDVIVDSPEDPRAPAFSDEALALRFAKQHAGDLRFVAKWNKWLTWTGKHWRLDDTYRAFDLARYVCRAAAAECNDGKGPAIASSRTRAAVENLARSDRRLVATTDQWDADPWLFNTPDGVIDLKTGMCRPPRPEDFITKIAAVGPGGDCPRFHAFLNRISGDDPEFVTYLQRVFGYTLTGVTCEHAVFFAYGRGANGKSVLLNTISSILGDYHRTAPAEAFTVTKGSRIPNDIAAMRGARMVTVAETEQGSRWAEARIKMLSGGDKIPARFMHGEWFDFLPSFKLFFAGNSNPSLQSVDEAIRRRLHQMPFAVTIPFDERDSELAEKLKPEWPGILSWMIAGCLQWQANGLRQPQAVRDATREYLAAQDALAAWIGDSCTLGPNARASSAELFASWTDWATAVDEAVGSQKAFSLALKEKGFAKGNTSSAKGFKGIALKGRAA